MAAVVEREVVAVLGLQRELLHLVIEVEARPGRRPWPRAGRAAALLAELARRWPVAMVIERQAVGHAVAELLRLVVERQAGGDAGGRGHAVDELAALLRCCVAALLAGLARWRWRSSARRWRCSGCGVSCWAMPAAVRVRWPSCYAAAELARCWPGGSGG